MTLCGLSPSSRPTCVYPGQGWTCAVMAVVVLVVSGCSGSTPSGAAGTSS